MPNSEKVCIRNTYEKTYELDGVIGKLKGFVVKDDDSCDVLADSKFE